jgi:phosphoserine phosphatase
MLRGPSFTGGSYLREQQGYRTETHHSTAIEDAPNIDAIAMGDASGSKVSRIVDSGIVHAISHYNCQAPSEEFEGGAHPEKLVATLFYKSDQPIHHHVHPDTFITNPSSSPERSAEHLPNLPTQPPPLVGQAPTTDMENYPLEPPPPEPEPLDHLYGPYITQMCLGHFLQVIQELQVPFRPVSSTHRCLDDPVHPRVVEVIFSPAPSEDYFSFSELRRHEALWRFEREWNCEIILQKESIFRSHKRLAVFDMDSTLIGQETIDELARIAGKYDEVAEITAKAMNSELDFTGALAGRVALLKGQPISVLTEVQKHLIPSPGAFDLLKSLRRLGFKTALLSGGFDQPAHALAKQLGGIDYVHANTLGLSEDGLTLSGTLITTPENPIVDGNRKRELVKQIAEKEGVTYNQVLVVGDGGNDLRMMDLVGDEGLGVAFRAKPKVQMSVSICFQFLSLASSGWMASPWIKNTLLTKDISV